MTQVAIDITDELRAFVDSSVEAGRFHSASEMVAAALHTLKSDEHAKFEALRADIAVGIAQADRGEFVEFNADSIKAEGRARLAASQASE
jgi:antitoxin ParD1/3/4